MAYYIIDKTNKINPNLIKSEVALFETEQDFLIPKQKWINDNTVIKNLSAFDEDGAFIEIAPENSILEQNLSILPLTYTDKILDEAPEGFKINEDETQYIELPNSTNTEYIQTILPNENDYQYRVATEIEKNQHFDDYLKYKIDNATETTIVVTHKDFQNIDNTSRQPMIDYIIAQHNQELFNKPMYYIEATGDLLNKCLAKELIEKENAEIERIKQLKIDAKKQITNKIKNTINKDTGQTKPKEITYNLYDNTKPLNANTKTIPMEGIDLVSSYNQINLLLASNNNPVKITNIDKTLLVSAPSNTIIKANQDIANEYVKQDLLIDYYDAHIDYVCKTEEDINDTLLFLEDEKNTDVDIIKDGKISIFIPIQDIIIYDNRESLLVKMGKKTLEETNITNKIFKELI
jgi:hypothetical protein